MGFADGQGSDVAGRQANRRLGAGIGVSLLLHALVLALRFGVPGSGGEAGGQAISVRIAATEPDPAPIPDPPLPPAPLPSAPPQPAAPTGMRLIPPRPPAAPPLAHTPPAPVKPRTPSKARRVSSPAPRAQFEEPPRLIAQDSAPNDFLVDVPQPQESERKTIDPLETQHGGEQGMENTEAQAQAEQEQEQQRLAEAQRQEAQRAAEQAERERQRTEQVAAQRALELAEQERLDRERSEQERLAQQERQTRDQLEQQRLAEEQAVRQRAEQERVLQQRQQQERLEQERLQRERLEQERLVQERLQRERLEQQRLAQERQQQERLAQERLEQQRLEQQRLGQERAAREQAERERLARQGAAQRSAPAPDDPFAVGPGAGGAGGNTGSGSGAAGRLPRDLSGPELKDRARELVKGLDLLKGAPPLAASGGKRRVVVGAAERDVPLRLYVDSWRMKIERTGAVHGPKAWASAGGADPLVNVAVRSDGTVEDVTIIRSSGRPDLDDKVRQIVRLNARYAQFPPNIAARYDVIDIRRIWRFDEGLKLQEELP